MTVCYSSPTGAHHWLIPSPHGNATEVARCKYCDILKELPMAFDEDPYKYLRMVPKKS